MLQLNKKKKNKLNNLKSPIKEVFRFKFILSFEGKLVYKESADWEFFLLNFFSYIAPVSMIKWIDLQFSHTQHT